MVGFLAGGFPFAGAAVLALLLAGGGFYAYERVEIAGLDGTVAKLQSEVATDSETIGSLNANLATAHSNERDLEASLDKQNAANAKLSAAVKSAQVRASKAQQDAAAHLSEAQGLAKALAAREPQNGSYADLVRLFQGRAP